VEINEADFHISGASSGAADSSGNHVCFSAQDVSSVPSTSEFIRLRMARWWPLLLERRRGSHREQMGDISAEADIEILEQLYELDDVR
jgi:hypothetical protein